MARGETGDDVDGFAAWLRDRRMGADHQRPHQVRWVIRFLRLRESRPREVWSDSLRVFLDDLDEANCPSWRIRQAADAVTLYAVPRGVLWPEGDSCG